MASVCKRQQCCVERRGFRQELDSWRYKLIHCVGFESILEGLFGPGLLNDLSLFKDCEPTGVCDWSFDENCLFCCLRREKVKEHLAGFNKSVSEPGQENLLKQEQAKIIRLERQAEEFINAVFYKKDCPRISDPNIPLVAREIMQRMIRQFAAEYTSKNSSTQDSSQPNSTKNQSLPKPSPGQSSPPPATTQNPVLSKLLMADQDSPLDLTVKKSQSEEPCAQDGVLDLSTKKSPCSGSTNSSISPSTSNAIGNGTQEKGRKAIDPINSTSLTLEKFMVQLCSHHQKQFIHVLNNLCTEEPLMNSRSHSSFVSDPKTEDVEYSIHSFPDNKPPTETCICSPSKEDTIKTATACAENFRSEVVEVSENLNSPVPLSFRDNSVTEITFLQSCSHSVTHPEGNAAKSHTFHAKPAEEYSQMLETGEAVGARKLEPFHTEPSECCVLSNNNSALTSTVGAEETEISVNLPKCADKENAQCLSPRQVNVDKDSDCKLKQNSVHTIAVAKHGNLLNQCDSFQTLNDHSVPSLHKIRSHENLKHSKSVKRCKNTPTFRKSEYDNQCDVVYINQPITTQYHLQNHKSLLCSRNTARKSTRGYLLSSDSCKLSTVRTLVRSPKVEDKGSCALHMTEALIIPNGIITQTLPSTNDVSSIHAEAADVEIGKRFPNLNFLPHDDVILHTAVYKEFGNINNITSMVEQSVNSEALLSAISLVHNGNDKLPFSGHKPTTELSQQPVEMNTLEQRTILLDDCNTHEDKESDVSFSGVPIHTATPPEMHLPVAIKKETVHSDHDTEHAIADGIFPEKPITEKVCIPIEKANVRRSSDCSWPPLPSGTAEGGILVAVPNSPPRKNSDTLESSSLSLPTDLESPPGHSTIANFVKENTLEETKPNLLQGNAAYVSKRSKKNTQIIARRSKRVKNPKNMAHLLEGYTMDHSKSCTVQMESFGKTKLNNLETTKSLKEANCSATANTIDGMSSKNVSSLLHKCAKIGETSNLRLQERSASKRATKKHRTITPFVCEQNGEVNLSSKTKEANGQNFTIKAEPMDYPIECYNANSSYPMASRRKVKKPPAPSDRCLRSRDSALTDIKPQIKPSLQIQISPHVSRKSKRRTVAFSTAYAPQCRSSAQFDSNLQDNPDDENCFVRVLSKQFAKKKPLFSERMFKNTFSSTRKKSGNVSISFEIGSNQRKVYFCSAKKNCLKVEEDDGSYSPALAVQSACPFELTKKCSKLPTLASDPVNRTRKKTKRAVLKPLRQDQAKLCKEKISKRHSAVEGKRPCRRKRSTGLPSHPSHNSDSINTRKGRPKFLDWCSEEESQERISRFNNKYMSVHSNWISLEKDQAAGPKNKKKADRLKEIWKTKKRVRKAKTTEESQSCSPVQMLFMNSFKISNICKWFLESTETKSLVIVKKINTRIPEEHQLPMAPTQKYSKASLYPHMLQAQRLKKHLKKFASVLPACNNTKTQKELSKLENRVQTGANSKKTVKEVIDSKNSGSKLHANKPTSAPILRKQITFRERLHRAAPVHNKDVSCIARNADAKTDHPQSIKCLPSSKQTLLTAVKLPTLKSVLSKKQRAKKRPKADHLIEPIIQTSKKIKVEIKQEYDIDQHNSVEPALTTKKIVCKVEKADIITKVLPPKGAAGKARSSCRAQDLKKGKTQPAVKKHSRKTQLIIWKRQTRSSKLRLVPPVLSDQRITKTSQPGMREPHRKLCTGSKKSKTKSASQEKKKNRSLANSSTQSKR
ncbi:ligand-dependent corepressor isoform X2 [Hyperolius riggenbachi]|uniref:ligand-dependent corepressor isoform X2 n=1 Tax=Hyperolius riggenbachi TaxID=752182 RepID=UPI0035A3A6F4